MDRLERPERSERSERSEQSEQRYSMMNDSTLSAERRRFTRTPVQMPLWCLRLDPDGYDVVGILDPIDVSRTGLGVTTNRLYYPGQRMVGSLPISETQGHRNICATVTRCQPQDKHNRIGLRFDSASVGSWCGISGKPAAAA